VSEYAFVLVFQKLFELHGGEAELPFIKYLIVTGAKVSNLWNFSFWSPADKIA